MFCLSLVNSTHYTVTNIQSSGIGGLAISTISRAAIDSLGWQWALRILGFMQFGLLIVTAISTRPLNKPPHYKTVPIVDVSDFKNKHFIMLVAIHFIGNFAFYVSANMTPWRFVHSNQHILLRTLYRFPQAMFPVSYRNTGSVKHAI